MRVLITNGYIVYYFNVVAFKTEIYDDDDDDYLCTLLSEINASA